MSAQTVSDCTGGPAFVPVWSSVWTGFVQPGHRFLTLPTGPFQEAPWSEAVPGGFDRVQPKCWQVSRNVSTYGSFRFKHVK